MTPAELLGLIPVIEELLRDAPTLVGDVEALIARVKGGPAPSPGDAAEKMAATDDELKKF